IYSNPKSEEFLWGREPDAAFVAAFADLGIDVAALSVAEAAERIKARGIRLDLTRALDLWATMRQRAGGRAPDWRQLLAIAELAAPDPWRNSLRQARRSGDREALQALAASADIDKQPPATLVLLGDALYESGAQDQALELLDKAHLCYPEDWWGNNSLGWYYFSSQPPKYEEATRHYTAAQAVRPRNPFTLHAIGRALAGKHAVAQATAVYRKAIELRPDLSEPYASLVQLLDDVGRGDEVAKVLRQAGQVKPGPAGRLFTVGPARANRGRPGRASRAR